VRARFTFRGGAVILAIGLTAIIASAISPADDDIQQAFLITSRKFVLFGCSNCPKEHGMRGTHPALSAFLAGLQQAALPVLLHKAEVIKTYADHAATARICGRAPPFHQNHLSPTT
jgi:hypothetical protein